jgi:hypothetical protein
VPTQTASSAGGGAAGEGGTKPGLNLDVPTETGTYRWLFNFLHDYDLPILLRNQPARDILVWLLSIAGLVISVSGVVVGWLTLARGRFP